MENLKPVKEEVLKCPNCKVEITGLKKIKLKKVYECASCGTTYFLEREPSSYFVPFDMSAKK